MRDCQVGVIGVGRMGKGIASSYLRAGFSVGIFDIAPEPVGELATLGAEVADSPADLATHCPVVSIVVRDENQLAAAVYGPGGLLNGVQPGTILLLHSTVPPADCHRLADDAQVRGARVLEATMTGGVQGAATGALTLMVAGDPQLLEECWPLMRAIAKKRIYVGELGAGGVCKAVQDTLYGVFHQAAHEALDLAVKAGISPDRFFEALAAKGWVLERWDAHWSPDGTQEKVATPGMGVRDAPRHLGPIVWALAEELGADMSVCQQAIARSTAIADGR